MHAGFAPAEEGVPEVVEEVQRRLLGRERVAGAEAADGVILKVLYIVKSNNQYFKNYQKKPSNLNNDL